jgi:hypothetical protein
MGGLAGNGPIIGRQAASWRNPPVATITVQDDLFAAMRGQGKA